MNDVLIIVQNIYRKYTIYKDRRSILLIKNLNHLNDDMSDEWELVYSINTLEGSFLVIVNFVAVCTILTSKKLRCLFNKILLVLLFATHLMCGLVNIFVGVVEIQYRSDQSLIGCSLNERLHCWS